MTRVNIKHFCIASLILFITPCLLPAVESSQASAAGEGLSAKQELRNHTKEFRKELIKLSDSVYTGVGYDGSNASMIIGNDGVIIVDTLRALGAAEELAADFREITNKPVKAIIYTHSHHDHTGGASAFAGQDKPAVYARANFTLLDNSKPPVLKALRARGVRQFGRDLSDTELINRGVAAGRTSTDRVGKGYLVPTETFDGKKLELQIAGINIHLVAAPGETDDQLYVWLPEEKALLTGDNYYKAFPNLYAIRGTTYRDVLKWAQSVDEMSKLGAEILVPGHTRPLLGQKLISDSMGKYSQAIFSIYDQTIAGINNGLTPDQIVEQVKLPGSLAREPNLRQYYGTVAWTVRSIFSGYLGWFDGNPTNLFPLPEADEANRIARLAGGADKLMKKLQKANDAGEHQWACQLADYLIVINGKNKQSAIQHKVTALRALAEQQLNAPARNYYLSSAMELEKK